MRSFSSSRGVGSVPLSVRLAGRLVVLTTLALSMLVVVGGAPTTPRTAPTAEVYPVVPSGSFIVDGHGFGHGHGMSQYGARGMARDGKTSAQIIGFYYPGTTLTTLAAPQIRVGLTGSTAAVQVLVQPGLRLSWSGGPAGGVAVPQTATACKLTPVGAGLSLACLTGSTWATVKSGLPASADFSTTAGTVRYYRSATLTIDYRGTVGAVVTAAGQVRAVNRVGLDDYVRGVVPREMPASWEAAAVQAQAIAARTYARYAVEHRASGSQYDICDTTMCQVYGGMKQYSNGSPNGIQEESGSTAAVTATANQVATYQGSTIFSQFSAYNGGWTVDGGKPYLDAHADPYEVDGGGDLHSWTRTVQTSDVAAYFGLASVSQIIVSQRDGHGEWGGRVLAGSVVGKDANGTTQTVQASGFDLADAMNLPHHWFHIRAKSPVGHVDVVAATGIHPYRVAGWAYDPDQTDTSIRIHIYVDNVGVSLLANVPRPDVQKARGLQTANVGFDTTVSVPGGRHTICIYAINTDSSSPNTRLSCSTVTVPQDPIAYLDNRTRTATALELRGWDFDPDGNGLPGRLHVYVDGVGHSYASDQHRPDVQAVFKLAADTVAFDVVIPLSAGSHRICMFAINNVGAGQNRALGCFTAASRIPADRWVIVVRP